MRCDDSDALVGLENLHGGVALRPLPVVTRIRLHPNDARGVEPFQIVVRIAVERALGIPRVDPCQHHEPRETPSRWIGCQRASDGVRARDDMRAGTEQECLMAGPAGAYPGSAPSLMVGNAAHVLQHAVDTLISECPELATAVVREDDGCKSTVDSVASGPGESMMQRTQSLSPFTGFRSAHSTKVARRVRLARRARVRQGATTIVAPRAAGVRAAEEPPAEGPAARAPRRGPRVLPVAVRAVASAAAVGAALVEPVAAAAVATAPAAVVGAPTSSTGGSKARGSITEARPARMMCSTREAPNRTARSRTRARAR